MTIGENISVYQREVNAKDAVLIVVSKTHPVEKIKEAYDAGQRIFGENKVQEMISKQEALPSDIEWHMIGHLQTNKVKFIAPFVHLIHSVDSIRLLQEIDRQAKRINRVIPCLLQIHIADEETKTGFDEPELFHDIGQDAFSPLTGIQIQGLMGMATLTDDPAKIHQEFSELRKLSDRLKAQELPSNFIMKELSMGMSSDYKIALEEGSTMVRIGSAIFGAR